MVGYGGKDLQKRKVLSLEWKSEGVMDDESGESMEPMEQVPLIQLGEAELERLVHGWRRALNEQYPTKSYSYVYETKVFISRWQKLTLLNRLILKMLTDI